MPGQAAGTALGVLAARDPDMKELSLRGAAAVAGESLAGALAGSWLYPDNAEAAALLGAGLVVASAYSQQVRGGLRRAIKAAAEREAEAKSAKGFMDDEGTWRSPLAIAVER